MAKYGSANLNITVTDAGAVVRDMTQYVTQINNVDVEGITEESTAFGKLWKEFLGVGVRFMPDITLTGFYDDTATTGPDVVFNAPVSGPSVTLRNVVITWGSTKTTSFSALIAKYSRTAVRETLHKYNVLLRPSGAVVEV